MDVVADYGLFLAKTATLLVALAIALGLVAAAIARGRSGTRREYLELTRLNDHFREMSRRIEDDRTRTARLKRRALRGQRRQQRAERRREGRLPRLFVLDFHGDMRASATDSLRQEVSAIIASAHDSDEVLLRLERMIARRKEELPEGSYTTHLFTSGEEKIRKKTGEEAVELILARSDKELSYEASDLIYHLLVLLAQLDIPLARVLRELSSREEGGG